MSRTTRTSFTIVSAFFFDIIDVQMKSGNAGSSFLTETFEMIFAAVISAPSSADVAGGFSLRSNEMQE